jgi:hypothetical protein
MEHGKKLGAGINCQPQLHHLLGATSPRSQFIQLEVWEPEVAKEALMQSLSVRALAGQPRDESGMTGAEDPLCSGRIQPTGSRRQHNSDLVRRGFQTVQGGVAPSTERGVASLTAKRLDPFSKTMLAIPKEAHERERL